MEIQRRSPALDRIIDGGGVLETLASGFKAAEGPVWDRRNHCLYFSDIPNSRIHRWSSAEGLSTFREPSSKSNGLTLDSQGRLLACEHLGRRVTRTEPDGRITVLASHSGGKRLNSPNDLVIKTDGAVYFTDPPFGLRSERSGAIAPQELDVAGVWCIPPDGDALQLVVDDFEAPNGLTFSRDETRLYVNDTAENHIRVFDVTRDGALADGGVFARLEGDGPGSTDGMKVDQEDNLYCTGPGGVYIFDASGDLLGRLKIGALTNVAWGDDDWRTLYVTRHAEVCRVRMKISGVPVGPAAI